MIACFSLFLFFLFPLVLFRVVVFPVFLFVNLKGSHVIHLRFDGYTVESLLKMLDTL